MEEMFLCNHLGKKKVLVALSLAFQHCLCCTPAKNLNLTNTEKEISTEKNILVAQQTLSIY